MVRWTITAATIVVLLACGQPENLEDRLVEAEKRLAMAEERIAAYERESATTTPLPTATPTPAPTATTDAGRSVPVDVYLRAIDLWPELGHDGVLTEECKHEIQKAGKFRSIAGGHPNDLHKRPLSTFNSGEYYRLLNVIQELKNPGEPDTVLECLVFMEQMQTFWHMKGETAHRWERGFPYPNSGQWPR